MTDKAMKVNIPLFMEVLRQLPGIDDEDISAANAAFKDTYNGISPGNMSFYTGYKAGDGDVVSFKNWSNYYPCSKSTTLHYKDDGSLFNYDIGASAKTSFLVARYFIATLFGMDELSEGARADFYADPLNPYESDRRYTPYVPELIDGARQLYRCVKQKGSVEACSDSPGMEKITTVKTKKPSSDPQQKVPNFFDDGDVEKKSEPPIKLNTFG